MFSRLAALVLACAAAEQATAQEKYAWLGHRHGCLVSEAAGYTHNLGSSFKWKNPPKTFFIELTACPEYVKRTDALLRDECLRHRMPEDFKTHYVLITDKLREFSEAWDVVYSRNVEKGIPLRGRGIDGSVLVLKENGTVAYSSSDADGTKPEGAWFLLAASCTRLD